MKCRMTKYIVVVNLLLWCVASAQHAVIVVIDGARYTETFGSDSLNIPYIWNHLRPLGTIWTHFLNDGLTKTDPGHASIATGTQQWIDNKGNSRPTEPTIFEYFRKYTGAQESTCAIVVGKSKLDILSYSTHKDYGTKYKASSSICTDDKSVVCSLKTILDKIHPRLVLVNLPGTDSAGHSGNWDQYLSAIHSADSLIFTIWEVLQSNSFYKDKTTMFITNDHGRHDDAHGGFENHGDECEGCRHIMLLAIGRGVPAQTTVVETHTQCDIAPTVGKLLSFPTCYSTGTNLLGDTTTIGP